MAASKRRPWAVEMKPPEVDKWFECGGYSEEDEANFYMGRLVRTNKKLGNSIQFRVRNILTTAIDEKGNIHPL